MLNPYVKTRGRRGDEVAVCGDIYADEERHTMDDNDHGAVERGVIRRHD